MKKGRDPALAVVDAVAWDLRRSNSQVVEGISMPMKSTRVRWNLCDSWTGYPHVLGSHRLHAYNDSLSVRKGRYHSLRAVRTDVVCPCEQTDCYINCTEISCLWHGPSGEWYRQHLNCNCSNLPNKGKTYTLYMARKICSPYKRFLTASYLANVWLWPCWVVCLSMGIIIPYAGKVLSTSLAMVICLSWLSKTSFLSLCQPA